MYKQFYEDLSKKLEKLKKIAKIDPSEEEKNQKVDLMKYLNTETDVLEDVEISLDKEGKNKIKIKVFN